MKYLVQLDEGYAIFKQYSKGDVVFARPIEAFERLAEAMKRLKEDAVPVNNVGGGHVAGLDIGLKNKKIKTKIVKRARPRYV